VRSSAKFRSEATEAPDRLSTLGLSSKLFGLRLASAGCALALVLTAGDVPTILAHYRIMFGKSRAGPRRNPEPAERSIVLLCVVLALLSRDSPFWLCEHRLRNHALEPSALASNEPRGSARGGQAAAENARGPFAGPRALELGPDRVAVRKPDARSKKGLTRCGRRCDVRDASLVEGPCARQHRLCAAFGREGEAEKESRAACAAFGGISEGSDIAMV
jgi:hypothetical protein